MNSREYLLEVKKRLPRQSDYALAKCLGVRQQTVSNYMNGKRIIDDTTALKVARILGEDPMKIIAAANADRETGEAKKKWENFYKQLGGMAAGLMITVISILSPTDVEAAPVGKAKGESVYIMLSRRLKQWAKNLALAVSRNCQMLPVHADYLG